MNRNQAILFTIASAILSGFFWMLERGAVGLSCTLNDIETNAYLVCITKHVVYGSFAIVFYVLTVAFFISIFLTNKEEKK